MNIIMIILSLINKVISRLRKYMKKDQFRYQLL